MSTAMVGSYVLEGAPVVTVAGALNTTHADVTWMSDCGANVDPAGVCPSFPAAAALAAAADIAALVLGGGAGGCGEWQGRDSLDLAGQQPQLLEAVAGKAPKTVVVLLHGRPQTLGAGNRVLQNVDALLAGWRPGEEGGTAVARILTGITSPPGKLAQSWPRSVGQVGGPSTP